MCGCLCRTPYWRPDLARNPGMCLDWESNQQPFGSQAGAQTTEPHQRGLICSSLHIFSLQYNSHTIKFTSLSVQFCNFQYIQKATQPSRLLLSIFIALIKRHHTCQHSLPTPMFLQPLTTTNIFSVSVDLPTLDIPYKWNHAVLLLLDMFHLACSPVHSCCSMFEYFILVYG